MPELPISTRQVSWLVFLSILWATTAVADDQLPPPAPDRGERINFPLEIRLLGYIQKGDKVAAFITVGEEPLILQKGEEKELSLGEPAVVTRITFSEIDVLNRSIQFGFPMSNYLPKTCGLKKAIQP